jgi:hypothetical protein
MYGSHALAKDATHESGGANSGLNVKSSYVYGFTPRRDAGGAGNERRGTRADACPCDAAATPQRHTPAPPS